MKPFTYILLLSVTLQLNCGSGEKVKNQNSKLNPPANFGTYWYQGEAEISSYELEQARYGQMNPGHAVLVFVTEDFSKKKHVKLDHPKKAGDDAVKVMKLNMVKKFSTGIYEYAMMSSVFTPVYARDYPYTLKVTTSSQEWCGHTFTQLNLEKQKYNVMLRSYFESEGDQDLSIARTWLEDEIWTRIRTQPENLPEGKIKVIPGTMYQRLSHSNLKPEDATAYLSSKDEKTDVFKLKYAGGRELKIFFNKDFPHKITSWEHTFMSGFGENKKEMTTKAKLKKTIKLDYWNKNRVKDLHFREKLGIE